MNNIAYQINAMTREAYEGRNQAELLADKARKKYNSNEWATFLQFNQMGRKIKKGSRGVSIFKGFKQFEDEKDGKRRTVSRPVGFATVFNLDQTESREALK